MLFDLFYFSSCFGLHQHIFQNIVVCFPILFYKFVAFHYTSLCVVAFHCMSIDCVAPPCISQHWFWVCFFSCMVEFRCILLHSNHFRAVSININASLGISLFSVAINMLWKFFACHCICFCNVALRGVSINCVAFQSFRSIIFWHVFSISLELVLFPCTSLSFAILRCIVALSLFSMY